MRARRPGAIRAPDDGRTEWFAGGAVAPPGFPRAGRLPQLGDLVALDQVEVDLDAEAGGHRCVDVALGIDLNVLDEAVLLCGRRQQNFEPLAVEDRRADVQVGDVVERVAAVVDLEVEPEALGQVGRLDAARDAALEGDIAAEVVGRLVVDPGREGVVPGAGEPGGQDRDAELLASECIVAGSVRDGQRENCSSTAFAPSLPASGSKRRKSMATLTIRIPDAHRDRLAALAAQRNLSLNKLMEELSIRTLSEHDTEMPFRMRAAQGDAQRGLEVLDELDRHHEEA